MRNKTGSDFENLELKETTMKVISIKAGPAVAGKDERKGLLLDSNYREYMQDFCTRINDKSDNNPAGRPQSSARANTLTLEIIRSGGIDNLPRWLTPSVYTYKDIRKHSYPKWRHTSEIVKRHYHQKALRALSEKDNTTIYTVNIKLSPTFAETIIEKGGCDYLLERLAMKLKRALNRSPLMWLVLEAVVSESNQIANTNRKGSLDLNRGLLHAHGAISLQKHELQKLKQIVAELNASDNSIFNSKQLRTKIIGDDVKWVEYCNKHKFQNQMILNGLKSYSRSKKLGSSAEEIYLVDREELKSK